MSAPSATAYVAAHEAALEKFVQLQTAPEWKLAKDEDGVKFYTRTEAGSSFSQLKSETTVAAPLEKVCEVLKVVPVVDAKKPEDGLKERYTFGELNDENDTRFLYVAVDSGSRLVTNRDFIMLRRHYVKDGKQIWLHTSVPDEVKPVEKQFVRGQMKLQGYIAEADGANTKLTFIVHTDPCGSIPAMIYNAAVMKQGNAVKKIREQAQK